MANKVIMLSGCVFFFISNAQAINTSSIKVKNITLKQKGLLDRKHLQPLLNQHIGKSMVISDLRHLSNQLTEVYQNAGYPLVRVVLPPQKIENGNIVLEVVDTQVRKVAINNKSQVKESVIAPYVHNAVQPNQTLNQNKSEKALLLLKDIAGINNVTYQLSNAQDGVQLDVDIQPTSLFDGYISVDNYGSKSTGELRTNIAVNANSPLGYGERFSLDAMTSFKGIYHAKLRTEVPVGYQGAKVNGAVSHTRYDLGGDFKNLDATGNSTTASMGVNYPLKRSNKSSIWLNSNLQYNDLQDKVGSTNTVTNKTSKSVTIGINGSFQDDILAGGYTQFGLNNTFGHLNIESPDAKAIDTHSAKTDGSFYKANINLSRTQYFNPQWSLIASLNAQLSNKNLDSSEQLSAGGTNGIAAYHSNDLSADQGVMGKLELRYRVNPYLVLSGFYDAGTFKLRHNPYTNNDNSVNLQGAGLGLYGNYKHFNVESKIAWRVGNQKFSNDKNPRVWISGNYQF